MKKNTVNHTTTQNLLSIGETIGFNINSYLLATMVQDNIKYSDETVTSWFEKNVYEFIKMIDDQEAIDYDLAIGNYEDDLYE